MKYTKSLAALILMLVRTGQKMKRYYAGWLLCGLLLSSGAQAAFINGGDGTITNTDTSLMWLQNANTNGAMNWVDANSWVDSLVFAGYDDWRLPSALQPDPSCSIQGGAYSVGAGCTGSEMGHLSNIEGISSATPGLFVNVQSGQYWSATEAPFNPIGTALTYHFSNADQGALNKTDTLFAWAVRDVVAVPEPGTLLLFAAGLGLLGFGRSRRRP
jgi:hypothetical protein